MTIIEKDFYYYGVQYVYNGVWAVYYGVQAVYYGVWPVITVYGRLLRRTAAYYGVRAAYYGVRPLITVYGPLIMVYRPFILVYGNLFTKRPAPRGNQNPRIGNVHLTFELRKGAKKTLVFTFIQGF